MTAARVHPKHSIWIRVDAAGERPLMLSDSEEMVCGNGIEWRFVAVVENPDHGRRLLEQLQVESAARVAVRARASVVS